MSLQTLHTPPWRAWSRTLHTHQIRTFAVQSMHILTYKLPDTAYIGISPLSAWAVCVSSPPGRCWPWCLVYCPTTRAPSRLVSMLGPFSTRDSIIIFVCSHAHQWCTRECTGVGICVYRNVCVCVYWSDGLSVNNDSAERGLNSNNVFWIWFRANIWLYHTRSWIEYTYQSACAYMHTYAGLGRWSR